MQSCMSSEKRVSGYLAHLPNDTVVSVVYEYTLIKKYEKVLGNSAYTFQDRNCLSEDRRGVEYLYL